MKLSLVFAASAAFAAQSAKVADASRASVSPSVPVGPARMAMMPGGRLMAQGISGMELIRG